MSILERARAASVTPPIVAWLAVAAFNLLTAIVRGVSTTDDAAVAYWHVVDAKIPEITAQWWLDGGPFLPLWSPMDRGPMQPAILVATGAIFAGPVAAYVVGVVVNSAWVLGAWSLFRALGMPEAVIRRTVVAVALCGPVWVNSVYPWPKLLAAGFCLGAAAAVLRRRAALAGLLAAAAALSHGSALFAVIGLIPFAVYFLRWRAVVAGAAFLAPALAWAVVPFLVAAPGQPRLIQWHLAGTDISTSDFRNPVSSVVHAYVDAGWSSVTNKINNLRVMIGDPSFAWGHPGSPTAPTGALPAWARGGLWDRLRALQLTALFLAPGVLLLGALRWRRAPAMLWVLGFAWALAYALMEWGGDAYAVAWLHTAPLAALIALASAGAVGLGRWAVPASAATFVAVWFIAPPVWP